MKRFIPIILLIFVLLFSGCDKTEYYGTFEEASKSLETETNTILTIIPIEKKFVVLYCDACNMYDADKFLGIRNAFSFATISKNDSDMYFIERQSVKMGTGGETLTTTYFATENEWDVKFTISEKDGRAAKSISDIDLAYEIIYKSSPAS